MENATKALLIAAAVLIAILLISLGVGVFNTASEQMGNADLSEYEVQSFNNKFKQYEGESVTGAEVNALLTTVFTHNNSQDDTSTCVKVTYPVNGSNKTIKASNALKTSPTKVSTGSTYTVKATYNTNTGLITSIKVTQN